MRNSFSSQSTPANVILALTAEPDTSLYAESSSSPIPSAPSSVNSIVPEKRRWYCHKDVLKSNSNYFKSILSSQFQEAEASIVFLPRGMFSTAVLDAVLEYMYKRTIDVQPELLPSIYLAADYLGIESLCVTIEREITYSTHGFNCYCESCIKIIPPLLAFTGPHSDPRLSEMTDAMIKLLIQDPERTLPTYWSSPLMVTLLTQNPEAESLHEYLENGLLSHVNKHNAIESLYGCFLAQEKIKDEALVATLDKVKKSGSSLLASDFIFYCTKYPKLLSCVDGITYSFEFLNYLICLVLNHQMNENNVCCLYKGIVKHLMCRDNVQRTPLVKTMLQSAKDKTIAFISTHIVSLKKLNLIDRDVVDLLSHDLSISPSALTTEQEDFKRRQTVPSSPESKKKYCNVMFHWNVKLIRARFSSFCFGQHFKVGQRVQLVNRPVSTTGTIVFVGKVIIDNKKQTEHRLGIQLDRTVGSNDGSIHGKRYFTTTCNRGVFVKPSEVILL